MSRKLLRSASLLIVVSLVFALLAGCSTSNEQTVDQEADEVLKIGVVVKALNSDYWKIVEAGALQAGKDLGVEVTVLGPSAETKVAEQVAMIEDQITKGVDALAIAPSQPSSAIPTFERAKEAGIPVVLIDTDADWDSKVSFVGTGNYAGGKQGGQYILDKLGEGAKVVILRGAMGDPTHDERANGAIEVMKAGGIEILDIQPANSDRGMGMSVMENLLQAHPQIDGVFATNDEMALGAIRAIQGAKRDDVKVVVGFDGSPDALKSIAAGELTASVAQSPYNIGYMGVEAAVKAAKGEKVDKRIDTGTEIIDKANVEEAQAKLDEILGN
ncbi:Ribose import binding protein RbsB [Koleobacter methoxysyntrophicus]|jgi:ribose transport system substrate-binding protein|uniref:Ribose import binding protein RbsB n=1 Tax=Koleobacter methoxysyntrophicus TaxID=2751313 RepID=A0A8A0RJP1_9FIRM|nr:sugar ABC transporter substrate-binding protein [Koleobacter methoxysyntrophicus]QSQ08661.1 Ribose import binding protein RbsB [Koleobacter methoxysyntrophicus]